MRPQATMGHQGRWPSKFKLFDLICWFIHPHELFKKVWIRYDLIPKVFCYPNHSRPTGLSSAHVFEAIKFVCVCVSHLQTHWQKHIALHHSYSHPHLRGGLSLHQPVGSHPIFPAKKTQQITHPFLLFQQALELQHLMFSQMVKLHRTFMDRRINRGILTYINLT